MSTGHARPLDSAHGPRIRRRIGGDPGTASADLLPGALPAVLAPHAAELVAYVSEQVQKAAPEYSFAGSMVEEIIALAVRSTVGRIPAEVRVPELACPSGTGADVVSVQEYQRRFRGLGRQEFLAGRSLEHLQSAYCAAGRASWHYLAEELAPVIGFPTDRLCRAAEAIFSTIEEISGLSAAGYADARAEGAGSRQRERSRLLRLILSTPPLTAQAVQDLAAAAAWPVPGTVVAVALEPAGDEETDLGLPLDPDVLRDLDVAPTCLVSGDPDTHLARLEARLGGRRAAIGPPVRVEEAAESLAIARRALELAAAGSLPDRPVLYTVEHLGTMLLVADESLVNRLAEHTLGELGRLGARQRERLGQTLLTWLQRRGNTVEIAEDLGVHPQTVRYRMAQLQEMFGGRLDDPRQRLDMYLALTSAQILGRTASEESWPPGAPRI